MGLLPYWGGAYPTEDGRAQNQRSRLSFDLKFCHPPGQRSSRCPWQYLVDVHPVLLLGGSFTFTSRHPRSRHPSGLHPTEPFTAGNSNTRYFKVLGVAVKQMFRTLGNSLLSERMLRTYVAQKNRRFCLSREPVFGIPARTAPRRPHRRQTASCERGRLRSGGGRRQCAVGTPRPCPRWPARVP